ncbi:MAG: hypothetical protein AAFR46_17785 [Pseudomonadota bacterium]
MSDHAMLPGMEPAAEPLAFIPKRAAGLARLDQFIARAGRHYAGRRSSDLGPDRRDTVSAFSPWIRHRLITEEEMLRATLARHAPSSRPLFGGEIHPGGLLADLFQGLA